VVVFLLAELSTVGGGRMWAPCAFKTESSRKQLSAFLRMAVPVVLQEIFIVIQRILFERSRATEKVSGFTFNRDQFFQSENIVHQGFCL
jgi:hypothetical protein